MDPAEQLPVSVESQVEVQSGAEDRGAGVAAKTAAVGRTSAGRRSAVEVAQISGVPQSVAGVGRIEGGRRSVAEDDQIEGGRRSAAGVGRISEGRQSDGAVGRRAEDGRSVVGEDQPSRNRRILEVVAVAVGQICSFWD